MSLVSLIEALPEAYQPIYGHPEFATRASRPCQDRLPQLLDIHDRLAQQLGRPIKILDLGCAQGFFSINLATRGAKVLGIDRVRENIAVCEYLAVENPDLSLEFRTGNIEDVLDQLPPQEIDLVLGLSVLHHLCAEAGKDATRALIRKLSTKVEAGLFEVALREEPIAWADAQPETPDWLYQDFSFLACIDTYDTHLSDHKRPLYFASNKYWFAHGTLTRFKRWSSLAHELDRTGHDRGRRYFETDDQLLKLFRFHGSHGTTNRAELTREQSFLNRNDISSKNYPRIIDANFSQHEGWLLRERLPGTLLSTELLKGPLTNPGSVVLGLLHRLSELESLGLFHEDLRTWNVLLSSCGEAQLIDYGSILPVRTDREFAQDWRIPFLILLHRIYHSGTPLVWPPKLEHLHPDSFPEPVAHFLWQLWGSPAGEWTWGRMAAAWAQPTNEEPPHPAASLEAALKASQFDALEKEVAVIRGYLSELQTEMTATRNRLRKWDRWLSPLKPVFRVLNRLAPARYPPPSLNVTEDIAHQSRICPVCKNGSSQTHIDPSGFSHPEFQLLECQACSSIFSNPLPTDEQLAELYQRGFDYRWYQDHFEPKLRDCRQRVAEYKPLLGRRILDFGGGVGYLSTALRESGFESLTYDPYIAGSAPEPGTWDTVIALHVLEHSNDVDRTLSEMKQLLKPDGRLILAVPNRSGDGYRKEGMRWVWAQPPLIHVFHFTASGLTALLKRHGFKNPVITYHERWDANSFCDLTHATTFRKRDALWSLAPFNRIPAYRRWIAHRNAKLRYEGLDRAHVENTSQPEGYAELQITACLSS